MCAPFEQRHTDRGRAHCPWLLHAWFTLIGVLVLTTYQPGAVLQKLAQAGHLDGISVATGTLEDVFLAVTGREFRS